MIKNLPYMNLEHKILFERGWYDECLGEAKRGRVWETVMRVIGVHLAIFQDKTERGKTSSMGWPPWQP